MAAPPTRTPFVRFAPIYDAVYRARGKSYEGEAERVRRLVRSRRGEGRHRLLDVACGTGEHLRHLAADFDVVGLDHTPSMLEVARAKLPGVPLHEADMTGFALPDRFDVVTCLFASVGYLPGVEALRRAVARMAAHLRPGGLLILEPALTPEQVQPPVRDVLEVTDGPRAIRRVTEAVLEPGTLAIRFRFQIDGDAFEEEHRIRLFEGADYEAALCDAGLRAHREDGWYVAQKLPAAVTGH